MIYIYKDRIINIQWTVMKGTSCVRENFDRALLKLFLIGPHEKYLLEASASEGVVSAEVPAGLPEGTYSVELIYVKNWQSLTRPPKMPECHPVDCRFNDRCIMRSRKDDLFAITNYETESENIGKGEVVVRLKTSVASYGYDGLSAYEIAVMRGDFTGTEGEWMDTVGRSINMYYYSYLGNSEDTRLQVPSYLRRTGLWISYVKDDKTVVTEWYDGDDMSDDAWKLDSNWRTGSNMLVGDLTISSEGNWVINGKDTGVKANKNTIGDEEDITTFAQQPDLNILRFADREPGTNNLGYVILRKNKDIISQMTVPNTIYEIRYDFDLGGNTLNVPEGCVLKFDGGSLKNGKISISSSVVDFKYYHSSVSIVVGDRCFVKNGYIDGSNIEGEVIKVMGTDSLIENMNINIHKESTVTECSGIHIVNSNNIKVVRCKVDGSKNTDYVNNPHASILVKDSSYVNIQSCEVLNSHLEGIYLVQCINCIVNECIAHDIGYSGIATQWGSKNIITQNIVNNTGKSCITINDSDTIVSKNIVSGNKANDTNAITLGHNDDERSYIYNVICEGNHILNGENNGICVASAKKGIIQNNIIQNVKNHGIFCVIVEGISADLLISNNMIADVGSYGIQAYTSNNGNSNFKIINNSIKNAYDAIRVFTKGIVEIIENNIDNCKKIIVGTLSASAVCRLLMFKGNIFNNAIDNCLEISNVQEINIEGNKLICDNTKACIELTSKSIIEAQVANYILKVIGNDILNYGGKCIDASTYNSDKYNNAIISNNKFYSNIELNSVADWICLYEMNYLAWSNNLMHQDYWMSLKGGTENRPTWDYTHFKKSNKGFVYYDTTINKYVIWSGEKWVDATGADV